MNNLKLNFRGKEREKWNKKGGIGKFLIVLIIIIVAIYFISPSIFNSGYTGVQNIFKNWNITLPNIPSYNGTSLWNNNSTNTNLTDTNQTNQNMNINDTHVTCPAITKQCPDGSSIEMVIQNGQCILLTCPSIQITHNSINCTNQQNWGQCTNIWTPCQTLSNSLTNQLKGTDCCDASGTFVNPKLYCNSPTYIHGSSYGTIRVYLYSSPESGYDLSKLQQIASEWKTRIYNASNGIIDNLQFYYDPLNPDMTKPNIDLNTISIGYYFTQNCYIFPSGYPTFSFQSNTGNYIYGETCPIRAYISGGGDLWHDTLHEFGHTLGCADFDGDIMRTIPILNDYMIYPPVCLEEIQNQIINHAVKLY